MFGSSALQSLTARLSQTTRRRERQFDYLNVRTSPEVMARQKQTENKQRHVQFVARR